MATGGTYDQGDRVRIQAEFRDLSNQLANPTTVTVQVKRADGTISTPSASNPSTGVFTADVDIPTAATSAGVWSYRFAGTGALVAAGEAVFFVRQSAFS